MKFVPKERGAPRRSAAVKSPDSPSGTHRLSGRPKPFFGHVSFTGSMKLFLLATMKPFMVPSVEKKKSPPHETIGLRLPYRARNSLHLDLLADERRPTRRGIDDRSVHIC
jgi:hypothetical protein